MTHRWCRRRGHPAEVPADSGSYTVIDAAAGPPVRPHSDPAVDKIVADQAAARDAPNYDADSFSDATGLLYPTYLMEQLETRLANTVLRQIGDDELQGDFVAAAVKRVTAASEHLETAQKDLAEAESERDRFLGQVTAEGRRHRRGEPRRRTRALLVLVPLVAASIEVPWSYFALQILGESVAATLAMAVLFGALGVALSELLGVLAHKARRAAGAARAGYLLGSVVAGAVLGGVAVFLASLRTTYLAVPVAGTTRSAFAMFGLDKSLVFVGWLAVNLGLYFGVAAIGYLRHPGSLPALQRADEEVLARRKALEEAKVAVVDAVGALDQARVRQANLPAKWDAHRAALSHETREAIRLYYGGLARAKANPDFTTAIEHHAWLSKLGLVMRPPTAADPPASPAGDSSRHHAARSATPEESDPFWHALEVDGVGVR